jgi:hypothetical protein
VVQYQIWQQIFADNFLPNAVENAIQGIIKTNPNFHVDGVSWTNHISWVQRSKNVLSPMYELSNSFHRKFDHFLANNSGEAITKITQYRQNLLHNLLLQTSCFRYWEQGAWTDYAREIYKRG